MDPTAELAVARRLIHAAAQTIALAVLLVLVLVLEPNSWPQMK